MHMCTYTGVVMNKKMGIAKENMRGEYTSLQNCNERCKINKSNSAERRC